MSEAARPRAIAAAAAATAERWSLPAVNGPIIGARRDSGAAGDSADRATQAERARGYEAGMAAGQAEIQRLTAELRTRIQRLESVLGLLAKPLSEVDDQVQQQLALLALAIGKQLARREIKASPGEIIALIRESIGRLPPAARDVRIHLHPEDAALVREHLSSPAAERAWTVVEDPTQSRGGCLVRTETSQIDLRFESRVNAIVSTLIGDERDAQREAQIGDPVGGGDPIGGEGADQPAEQPGAEGGGADAGASVGV